MNIMTLDTTKKQAVICTQFHDVIMVEKTKENDTHSESLLPKIEQILMKQQMHIKDIDVFGVLIGPGSFTGIRIGVSMVKAFLFNTLKQCVAVNSFELLAYKVKEKECFVVALSADGRGAYVAEFDEQKNITHYDWISLEELNAMCEYKNKTLYVKQEEQDYFKSLTVNKHFLEQNDNDLLLLVNEKIKNNEFTDKNKLEPLYIRLSQAEDQLKQNFYKNVTFEPAKISDLEVLLQLERDIFKEEAYETQSLLDELQKEDRVVILAKFKNEVIGYVMVLKTLDNLLNIIKIAVTKNYRNLKVATKLVEQVLSLKQKEQFDKVFLEVNEHNKEAIAFYKKMGFTETYKRQKYYKNGDAAIVMFL